MARKEITDDIFDAKLLELAETLGVEHLIFSVPGVYEAVSEYLNNDVLDTLVEDGYVISKKRRA